MISPAVPTTSLHDPAHILVVDDDTRIRELLVHFLGNNGFRVSPAADVAKARDKMRSLAFDLIVLDIMMPGENGLTLAHELRANANGVPILFLSALTDTTDRIAGLSAGGDDYLAKPFEPQELLLRINSILKRTMAATPTPETVSFGPFDFHLAKGELKHDGTAIRLTTRERDMLRILAAQPGVTIARTALAQPGQNDSARSVDVQINRLRRKIENNTAEPVFLQTVRGQGYTLVTD